MFNNYSNFYTDTKRQQDLLEFAKATKKNKNRR